MTGPTTLTTPMDGPNIPSRFETPVDQPKPDSSPFVFPAHPHQIVAYCYSKWKENNKAEVELFRAVTKPEYEQIKQTGNFQGIGNDIKFFARSLDEAKHYVNLESSQEYVIVSTKIKGRIKDSDQAYVDGGINAVVFRDKDLFRLSPPTMVDQGALLKDYMKQADGQVMKLPGTYTGFTYDHSKQNFGSEAASNSDTSNIIPNQQAGQQLIDSAYVNPQKPKQLFNYYQGNVVRFRMDQNGTWQSATIENGVERAVGTNILKEFRNDGLISNAEYKKLLKM